MVRCWNVSDAPANTTLSWSDEVLTGAALVSHIETGLAAWPVDSSAISADFARQQMRSWRVMPATAGDVNCDGNIDNGDIDPFVWALIEPEYFAELWPSCDPRLADVNFDGRVNNADIDPFVAILIR